jgi:predicted house-cleaning noncanonical NTP pyrophosphatase (MazG superfamily)
MILYNKLVRDRIPEIIAGAGKTCDIQVINDNQKVIELLEAKLLEEMAEYKEARDVEEIADMVEVMMSLAERLGTSRADLLKLAEGKAEKRGGFAKGLYLVSVSDK